MPPTSSTDRFDEIRRDNPELQFYISSVTAGRVTLEIVTPDDAIFPFTGPSLADALEQAFPTDDGLTEAPEPSPIATDIFD